MCIRDRTNPKLVVASEIAAGTDLIVTAHSHARIAREALAVARLGGIGYHPVSYTHLASRPSCRGFCRCSAFIYSPGGLR